MALQNKTFDAMKFKEEMQRKVREELSRYPREEWVQRLHESIAKGPLGEWWKSRLKSPEKEDSSGT